MKYRHLTLLCGYSALIVSQALYAVPVEAFKPDGRIVGRASAQADGGMLAYFGPEEDEAEDQAEAQAEEEAEDQAEEEAEDQAEEEAEDQAEEEAEDQAEEEAEDQAEEEAEEQAEEEAEDQAEEEAEDQAEEEAEDQAEEEAEEQAEEEAEDQAEEEAEDQAEEEAEEQAEEEAEEQAEEEAEEQAEEEAEDQAEEEAEEQAEEEAEEQAEEEAEEQAEEEAEEQAEEEAEEQAEEEAEEQAEEEAEDQAEELEDAAEEAAEDAEDAAEEAAEAIEHSAREFEDDHEAEDRAEGRFEDTEDRLADRLAHDDDASIRHAARERTDAASEKAAARFSAARVVADRDYLEIEDEIGESYIADEIIYLAEMERAEALELEALEDQSVEYLEGLDMVLVRARTSKPEDIDRDIEALGNMLPTGAADRNHLYSPDSSSKQVTHSESAPVTLARKLQFDVRPALGLKIGLIDTAVAEDHAILAGGAIISRDFVVYDADRPKGHGTAVASILIGSDDNGFFGLAPQASLYSASVFFETGKGRQVATAESLVRALDWMLREKVQVVNMSLSGPQNDLVEVAVRRASEKGLTIVAAVGNAGPSAKPLYPAAIEPVVAVTAVDANGRVFLRANRGRHVDIAAPGVAIDTADATGGYKANTGTSIAAPFVAAMLAQLARDDYAGDPVKAFEAVKAWATDLGEPGFDEIYGYGLIRIGSE